MTIGAAQILINRERICPSRRTIVIGSSDMALAVAKQLHDVGIEVVGVVETSDQMSARDKATIEAFRETAIPTLLQTDIASASGHGKVEAVCLQPAQGNRTEHKHPVDFVCLDGGRHPILEALAMLKCQFAFRKALGGWVPSYTPDFEASVSGIFAAGQAAGITGHAGICLTGAIAGVGAVQQLEKGPAPELQSCKQAYWRELEQLEAATLPDIWQARQEHVRASVETCKRLGECNG
jgi:sarcosine oxidase subunit alpha